MVRLDGPYHLFAYEWAENLSGTDSGGGIDDYRGVFPLLTKAQEYVESRCRYINFADAEIAAVRPSDGQLVVVARWDAPADRSLAHLAWTFYPDGQDTVAEQRPLIEAYVEETRAEQEAGV